MVQTHNIAAVPNENGADTQAILFGMASRWADSGAKVAGVLAESHGLPDRSCSAGFLRDIASGKRFSIYLDTPRSDTTCHLDAEGVEGACAGLLAQIPSSDIVVLSKFGKLEAARQGLWDAFSAAVAAGKPLLTTISPRQAEAWKAFAPDAVLLKADAASIAQWWNAGQPAA